MGFSCGIVGLPNVGKSTLFNALTRAAVPAANYPFSTTDQNVGVVPVPEPRLEKLAELVPGAKVVPTSMRFVDIAGLVKGSHKGEGLGNKFLGHIQEVEAMAHVVRCFEDPEIVHVTGSVDPKRDIEVVKTELILRDLEAVTETLARVEKTAKSGDKKVADSLEVLKPLRDALNQASPARTVTENLSEEDRELVRPLHLLTAKPTLYVANIGEKDLTGGENPHLKAVREAAAAEGASVVPICAAMEAQIAELEKEQERAEFLEAAGLKESGLTRLIRAGYELLGLITFFTVVGGKQIQAWTIPRGTPALGAAGKVHSDMARGFIRAEVVGFEEFVASGGEAGARQKGRLRVEGKAYPVQDGEVIHFRFSV